MAKRKKSTALVVRPVLVPQKHGGAIHAGGIPGNPGNPKGRTPKATKERALRLLEDRQLLERMARIASGEIGEIKYRWNIGTQSFVEEFCEAPLKDQIAAFKAIADIADVTVADKQPDDGGKKNIKVFVLSKTAQEKAS